MTQYKLPIVKKPQHEFVKISDGCAYCNYGKLKTYANRTQAENKVIELRLLGFDCFVTCRWPFLILLNNES